MTLDALRSHRDAIVAIARQYGAHDLRVFGSVARGDARRESDVDLIVRFEPNRSLFDHGGLLMDLRTLLGTKVDVIDEEAMGARFRTAVASEVVPL